MSLEPGNKLGPYEIVEEAGAGGMGEVYKATDTRLERTVAIKVLPTTFAITDDLRQRFEREAKAISSLNHPNICTLYDVGREGEIDYLVMEFIEGDTLSERLKNGPMTTEEALKIAIEITDALDKAHKQGLIHRDLKPGNVMLTKEGAKLLDFGLAKVQIESAPGAHSNVTMTTPLTGHGMIVGTVQYMAPEQLEGKEADARSDIFAFGALLYEMLTGVKAFSGESQASLIASIIKEKPRAVAEFQPMAPPMLEQVIGQCLAKDPDQRWQSAGDLKRSLVWVSQGGSQVGLPAVVSQKRRLRENIAWVAAFVLFAATVFTGYNLWRLATEPIQIVRAHILAPDGYEYLSEAGGSFVLSHDGTRLAFTARDTATGEIQLFVRPLNSLAAIPLPGTDEAYFPFWSPDDKYIAFFARGKLKKILSAGGPTLTICPAPAGRDGDWNADDIIVFSPNYEGPLHKVAAAGGESASITVLDTAMGESTHRWVKYLPDGRHFLFYSRTGTGNSGDNDAICLGSLDTDTVSRLISAATNVDYASGHLLYQRETSLMAHPFDPVALEFTGDAFPIAQPVSFLQNWSRSVFTVSDNGVLVYRSGTVDAGSQLYIRNRQGEIVDSVGKPQVQYVAFFSPDEKQVVVSINDQNNANIDVWTIDLARKIRTRLTFSNEADHAPRWSPDGKQIAFRSGRVKGKKGLYIKNTSGVGESRLIYETSAEFWIDDWSPDGKNITIMLAVPQRSFDMWIVPLEEGLEPYAFIGTEFFEGDAEFSPDGRWLAYVSDATGQDEVYVTSFPVVGSKWQISTDDGDRPRWRQDGREIYYLSADDKIIAVKVDGSKESFVVGNSVDLMAVNASRPGAVYDVSDDGQRFLTNEERATHSKSIVVLVKNWDQELEH